MPSSISINLATNYTTIISLEYTIYGDMVVVMLVMVVVM